MLCFPREDIAMALLGPSETRTTCPKKGEARYWSIHATSALIEDAGWSYDTPLAPVGRIAGHIALYSDKVTIEQI